MGGTCQAEGIKPCKKWWKSSTGYNRLPELSIQMRQTIPVGNTISRSVYLAWKQLIPGAWAASLCFPEVALSGLLQQQTVGENYTHFLQDFKLHLWWQLDHQDRWEREAAKQNVWQGQLHFPAQQSVMKCSLSHCSQQTWHREYTAPCQMHSSVHV